MGHNQFSSVLKPLALHYNAQAFDAASQNRLLKTEMNEK